jgi:hypothetical protein
LSPCIQFAAEGLALLSAAAPTPASFPQTVQKALTKHNVSVRVDSDTQEVKRGNRVVTPSQEKRGRQQVQERVQGNRQGKHHHAEGLQHTETHTIEHRTSGTPTKGGRGYASVRRAQARGKSRCGKPPAGEAEGVAHKETGDR